jgi:hypothetical protein
MATTAVNLRSDDQSAAWAYSGERPADALQGADEAQGLAVAKR